MTVAGPSASTTALARTDAAPDAGLGDAFQNLVAFQPGGTLTRPAPPTLPPPTTTPPGPKPGNPGGSGSPGGAPAPLLPGRPAFGGVDGPSAGDGKLVNPGNLESSMGLLQTGLGSLNRDDMLGRLDSLVSLGNRGESATLPFGHGNDFVNARYDPGTGYVEFGNGARIPMRELLDRLRVRDEDLRKPSLSDLAAVRDGPQAQGGLAGALNPTLPPPEPAPVESPSAPAAPARTPEERRNEAYRQGFAKLSDYRLGGRRPDVMPPGEEGYVTTMAQAEQAQGRAAVTFRLPVTVDGQTFQLPGYFSGSPEDVEKFKRDMGPKNGLRFVPVLPPGGTASPPAAKPSVPAAPGTPATPSTGSPTGGAPVTSPPAPAPVQQGPTADEIADKIARRTQADMDRRIGPGNPFDKLYAAQDGIDQILGRAGASAFPEVRDPAQARQIASRLTPEDAGRLRGYADVIDAAQTGIEKLDGMKPGAVTLGNAEAATARVVAKAAEGLAPGGTPDRKDDVVPVTVGEPQPSTGPGTGTDTDRKDDFDVAAFTRVTVAPNGSIAAAGTYFDPGDEKNAPRNLVVNRLVHVEGLTPNLTDRVNSGHDAMHFITGFGINPKGADRIPGGQAFGATALELGGVMTPEDQQRNLNGILIENIVDGAKEAMFDQLSNREILAALPAEPRELRETAGRILFDLKKRTGYAIIQDGIVEGTDFHRQARQLAPESDPGAGLGRMEESPAVPDAERYVPKMDNVKFHHDNFNRLFEDNPKVLNDLKANLVKYLEYAARAEMAYAETGRAPSVPPLELTLPPDSTEALMRTAIKGLDQLDAAYPGADGIDELRNFYDSVLETGGDGSPQISQAPAGPALA